MKQFDFQKIKQFREAAGMTQIALAAKIGVSSQQISTWERGRGKGLTVRTLSKLCDALRKKTDDFFTQKGKGE